METTVRKTSEELKARNVEIKGRLEQIDVEGQGRTFTDEEKEEWNRLSDELELNRSAVKEMDKRKAWLDTIGQEDSEGPQFSTPSPRSRAAREDIWDLTTIRSHFSTPEAMYHEATDRAQRAIEGFVFPHPQIGQRGVITREQVQEHLVRLLETGQEETPGDIAHHILRTGSPIYKRAFGKKVMGDPDSGRGAGPGRGDRLGGWLCRADHPGPDVDPDLQRRGQPDASRGPHRDHRRPGVQGSDRRRGGCLVCPGRNRGIGQRADPGSA
jgi:hypothetical protein